MYLCSGEGGQPAAEGRGGQPDHAVRQRDVVPLEQHQHVLPAEDHRGNPPAVQTRPHQKIMTDVIGTNLVDAATKPAFLVESEPKYNGGPRST